MSQNKSLSQMPFVKIIEQPARGGTRFRYECEGRSAGSIPGRSTTKDLTTYPTIQVMNYSGTFLVIVSTVTKDFPYRQHPHNLVGERCINGICKIIIDNKDMIATFPSMGIQCAKRNDIRMRLKRRQAQQIDPFQCGFDHMLSSSFEINLSAVRLCFQVFIEDLKTGQYEIALQPIVSDVIFDKKSCNPLNLIDISTNRLSCSGSKLMLFTSFVLKDDIEVLFYEIDSSTNRKCWQDFGSIVNIYRHICISLLTPKYPKQLTQKMHVYMQLRRLSDQEISSPIKLEMMPKMLDEDINVTHSRSSNLLSTTHLLTPTLRLSPISSPKKFCATNDSWQQIAKNKPHFPFPILKAAIKRNLTAPQNLGFTTNYQTFGINHNYSVNNRISQQTKQNEYFNAIKSQTANKNLNQLSFSLTTESSNQNVSLSEFNCQQNLVIDLTTGLDSSKHTNKTISESEVNQNQFKHFNEHNFGNFNRKSDFCCQVNTINDEELTKIKHVSEVNQSNNTSFFI